MGTFYSEWRLKFCCSDAFKLKQDHTFYGTNRLITVFSFILIEDIRCAYYKTISIYIY